MIRRSLRIFLVHRVTPDDVPWGPAMHPADFDRYLHLIRRLYRVVDLEEYLDPRFRPRMGRPYAALTFDDGFLDNLEHAVPILERHGLRASFYVITACVESGTLGWSHRLLYALCRSARTDLQLERLPDGAVRFALPDAESRVAVGHRLVAAIRHLGASQREAVVAEVEAWSATDPPPRHVMSWSELAELRRLGHTVGSHSHTHPHLGAQTPEEMRTELRTSYDLLTERLGAPPRTLAYPFGSASPELYDAVRASSYRYGLLVGQQFLRRGPLDPFRIPRMDLYSDSPRLRTALRIVGV